MQCHGDEEGVRRQLHVKAYEEPEMAVTCCKIWAETHVTGKDNKEVSDENPTYLQLGRNGEPAGEFTRSGS